MKARILDDIQNSANILGSFTHYSNDLHKISITYYTAEHAITIEAWAKISFSKRQKASQWCDVLPVFKPYDYEAEQIEKSTGAACRYNGDESVLIKTFKALCIEIDKRNKIKAEKFNQTPKLYLEPYQSFPMK